MLAILAVPNITLEEDLTKRTPTIETVLKDLPSEHRLKEMMEHPYAETPEIRQKILSGYKGTLFHMQASTRSSEKRPKI